MSLVRKVAPRERGRSLFGSAARSARAPLGDAARRASIILAAGVLATVAATAICIALDIHDVLSLSQLSTVEHLYPHLHPVFFIPEPVERAQTVAFIGAAFLTSFTLALRPTLVLRAPRVAGPVFAGLFAVAIIACLAFGKTSYHDPIRDFFTFRAVWKPEAPTLWATVLAAAALPVLLPPGRMRRALSALAAACALVALIALCARYSFVAPTNGLAWNIRNHHDSAALHSVVQSAFGQIPYIDFVPQYGGYGLFAIPFFKLGLQPWTALCSFLFVCTLLSFLSMAAATAVASRSWKCGSFAAVIAFWLGGIAHAPYTYFQTVPVRTLFPSIFLALFSLYPRFPGLICTIGGLMVPIALYWNPETGLACLVATASFLAFHAVVRCRHERSVTWSALRPTTLFILACVCASAVLTLATILLFGHAIHLAEYFQHMVLFSKFGYFNLPMPALDVWLPAAFAFCLLLSFPDSVWVDTERGRILFGLFCAMLFSGLFFYYQGRSYTGNLLALAFPLVCGACSWLGRKPIP